MPFPHGTGPYPCTTGWYMLSMGAPGIVIFWGGGACIVGHPATPGALVVATPPASTLLLFIDSQGGGSAGVACPPAFARPSCKALSDTELKGSYSGLPGAAGACPSAMSVLAVLVGD